MSVKIAKTGIILTTLHVFNVPPAIARHVKMIFAAIVLVTIISMRTPIPVSETVLILTARNVIMKVFARLARIIIILTTLHVYRAPIFMRSVQPAVKIGSALPVKGNTCLLLMAILVNLIVPISLHTAIHALMKAHAKDARMSSI